MNDPLSRPTLAARHRTAGWWGLALFVAVGIALEALHGFKIGWYLDLSNETRRHLLTLGHAHGTLVALVSLAFATLPGASAAAPSRGLRAASPLLLAAQVALPAGFLLGGLGATGGDPGLGIVAVPVGAACLLAACVLAALSTGARSRGAADASDDASGSAGGHGGSPRA